jgi:GNAT superfamily N-acetyltransferase
MRQGPAVSVELLADRPDLLPSVARLRRQEWGTEPGRQALRWWIDTTRSEAGRDALPIAFVAVNSNGEAIGAVSLAPADLPERSDLTPWVVGTIVHADHRGAGIGGALMTRLQQWAAASGIPQLWVATGGQAVSFYRRCGWRVAEVLDRADGGQATILTVTPGTPAG